MIWWIIVTIVVIVIAIIVFTYNGFIRLRNRIENAWSQIDVQLKRRADLIPNLIKTVKGYIKHEKGVLTEVTKARTELMKAKTVKEKAKAENMLSETLKSLFAVAENYPNLKANENFKMLQEELAGTENKISYARQFYNDQVLRYDNKREMFPTNILANIFNFKEIEYFKAEEKEKKNIDVEF